MARDVEAGGTGSGGDDRGEDALGRLTAMADRSCLMAIDQVLRGLPRGEEGFAAAARDAKAIAARMVAATQDLRACRGEG